MSVFFFALIVVLVLLRVAVLFFAGLVTLIIVYIFQMVITPAMLVVTGSLIAFLAIALRFPQAQTGQDGRQTGPPEAASAAPAHGLGSPVDAKSSVFTVASS